jgi:hypothetical protein
MRRARKILRAGAMAEETLQEAPPDRAPVAGR